MRRLWIAAFASIALLVQSLGMAWASVSLALPHADQATAVTAETMPCHGDAAASAPAAEETASDPCDCCNSGCLFACGGAPLPAALRAPPAQAPDHVFAPAPVLALRASHTISPFRPPAR